MSRREEFIHAGGANRWPDGTAAAGFRFHHALYRDVLYERVPVGHRIELHRRIALREERAWGERVGERASELAHHFYAANDKVNAVKYLQMLAERATARGASIEAQGHYTRALNLLAELPQNTERDRCEFRLQLGLGTALSGAVSWAHPDPRKAFLRARKLAAKLNDTQQLAAALFPLAQSAHMRGQMRSCEELSAEMLQLTDARSPRWLLCVVNYMFGYALMSRVKFEKAWEHLELASCYFEEDSPELSALGTIVPLAIKSQLALQLGFPDRALRLLDEALHQAERRRNSLHLGYTLHFACLVKMTMNEWDSLFEVAEKLKRVADANPYFIGAADFCGGVALLGLGGSEEGLARMARASVFWERLGYRHWRPLQLGLEAQFCASQDALGKIAQALDETDEIIIFRASVLMFRGDVLLSTGAEASKVEAAYRESIECARVHHGKWNELESTMRLARFLKSQDRAPEAQTMLAAIYGWFVEGFETRRLREAKALLEELETKRQPPSSPVE